MPGRSFRVAKIAGIPVGVNPWWLVIVALITWSLGAGYYPDEVAGIAPAAAYALGLASVLLLFASILAHEFGHALVARRRGLVIEEIDLWLLGGVAWMRGRPRRPRDEFDFALAGPAVTAVIAVLFGALLLVAPHGAPALRALILYEAEINVIILGFNLIPAFPLDGGRVLRALLWWRSGDIATATTSAARIGRAFGWGLIAFGVLLTLDGFLEGLWLAVIGFFMTAASAAEQTQEQFVDALAGVSVTDLMSHPAVCVPADLSPAAAAEQYFARYRYTAFPVIDGDGRVVGLLRLDALEHLPHAEYAGPRAGEFADRDPGLMVDPGEEVTGLLQRAAFARVGRASVVDSHGRPLGVISMTDLERALRASRIRTTAGRPTRLVHH